MDSPGNVTYNKISERQDSKKMPERGGHEKVQQRKHTDGAEDGVAVCTGIIFCSLGGNGGFPDGQQGGSPCRSGGRPDYTA